MHSSLFLYLHFGNVSHPNRFILPVSDQNLLSIFIRFISNRGSGAEPGKILGGEKTPTGLLVVAVLPTARELVAA
jgi:hypothetical protein